MSHTNDRNRTWAIVQFELNPDHEEMASWLMMHNGASGCEIIPSENKNRIVLAAIFDKPDIPETELISLQATLEEYGLSDSLRSVKVSTIEEEDWLERWKEGFHPFTVGERITICPPWEKEKLNFYQKADRHVIYIEPGMAFGTGLHVTTQYCLRMIEAQKQIGKALDVGTGSGILSIACALLHDESEITALDIDPQAIKTASENCQENGVAERVRLVLGTTNTLKDQSYNVIFSNLTAEDIMALLPEYERLLVAGGLVFCAGILEEKMSNLKTSLAARRWKILNIELRNGWAGLCVQR